MGQLELPLKGHQFELGFDEENFIKVELEKPKMATPPKPAKPKVKPDKFGIQARAQKVRMSTTGWIASAGHLVRNLDEAGPLPAPIRKGAQELIDTITAN